MAMENSCVTPATMKIQLDLFLDYASNVALYPKFHEYFATKRPPFLAVWGKNDPPAPRPSVADNPNAEVHFYHTGHFALETHVSEIATAMRSFSTKQAAAG